MKIILTELRDQKDFPKKGNQWFNEGTTDITIDGKEYKGAVAYIAGGKVYNANIHHKDLSEELIEKLSDWWYGVNFAGLEYEFGTETELS